MAATGGACVGAQHAPVAASAQAAPARAATQVPAVRGEPESKLYAPRRAAKLRGRRSVLKPWRLGSGQDRGQGVSSSVGWVHSQLIGQALARKAR